MVCRQWPRRAHDPLGRTRPDAARLLFDAPRPQSGWMQLELARRRRQGEPRQPHRRVRRGRAPRRRRRRGASDCSSAKRPPPISKRSGVRVPEWQIEGSAIERSAAGRGSARPLRDPGRGHPGGQRGQLPHAPGDDAGAGRRIRLGQVGASARASCASCRATARSRRGAILFADPRDAGGADRPWRNCRPTARQMRAIRGGRISIIFQEPMSSLSPLHTIGDQVGEALRLHRRVTRRRGEGADRSTCCAWSAFPTGARAWRSYPFELSGGLRQRAMIAMALVCRPALLIADEPTTALDVTIQAQILKLIVELQHELGMAVLLITHDLGVVANVAEEIVVMYRGEVMESGTLDDIFERAAAPLSAGAAAGGAALRHEARRAAGADPRDPAGRRAASDGGGAGGGRAARARRCSNASISARASRCAAAACSGAGGGPAGHGGRRRQPADRARRMPRPRRRERLRQDDAEQDIDARGDARIRARSPSTTAACRSTCWRSKARR